MVLSRQAISPNLHQRHTHSLPRLVDLPRRATAQVQPAKARREGRDRTGDHRRIISANDLGEFSRRILSANSLGEFSRRILSANVTGVAIHIHVHYIHVSQFNGPDERAGRAVKECAAHAEARLLIGYARPVEEVLSVLGATRVNSPREFAEISRVIRRDNVPR